MSISYRIKFSPHEQHGTLLKALLEIKELIRVARAASLENQHELLLKALEELSSVVPVARARDLVTTADARTHSL